MNGGFIAFPPSSSSSSSVICPPRIQSKLPIKRCTTFQSWTSSSIRDHTLFSWDLKFTENGSQNLSRISLRCNCSINPGGPSGQGENESKTVLDAFFLGKALAEAVNERIESAVGEFLGAIGRLQAEQQKQVQDFQEEVLERAKRAKEKAAREAMEAQGIIPKSSTTKITPVSNGVASEIVSSAGNLQSEERITKPDLTSDDPLLGISNED